MMGFISIKMKELEFDEPTPISVIISSNILSGLRKRIDQRFKENYSLHNATHSEWVKHQIVQTETQFINSINTLLTTY